MGECLGVCAVSGGRLGAAHFLFKKKHQFKKIILKKYLVVQEVYPKSHHPEKSYYPETTIINIQEDHSRFLFMHICR